MATEGDAWIARAVVASFALLVVSQILRVVGTVRDDGLVLIFGSIGLSVCAACAVFVAVRRSKRRIK